MDTIETSENDFERPLLELRQRIAELEEFPPLGNTEADLTRLRSTLIATTQEVFRNLNAWQKTLLARHSARPYTLDYIEHLFEDFVEIHGDRRFGDDPSIVGGLGLFNSLRIAVVGHQKGRGLQERIRRNFGQPRPEGYRKALRIFKMAERFGLPVLTFIDTPGAFPGIEGEERGQAEAIARNLIEMMSLKVPIIAIVTGEGGSGGALALGVADHVIMLEHAIYSVISPEGCAAILWKDQARKSQAASALKLTAQDLLGMGIVDEVLDEPLGGAHVSPVDAARYLGNRLGEVVRGLSSIASNDLVAARFNKFRKIGNFSERSVI